VDAQRHKQYDDQQRNDSDRAPDLDRLLV